MTKRLYLGVGPGEIHPQHQAVMDSCGDNWELSDKFVSSPDIKNYDALNIPYPDNSIDSIYNSHLLEHLSFRVVQKAIKHWYDKLKKGGEIIINVPDLEWTCFQFLQLLADERAGEPPTNQYYNRSLDYSDYEHTCLQIFYGSQAHEGEYHKNGFTRESLTKLLEEAGFKKVVVKNEFEAHEIGCLIARAKK